MNSCEVTVHTQKKKKKKSENVLQDSAESKRSLCNLGLGELSTHTHTKILRLCTNAVSQLLFTWQIENSKEKNNDFM